MERSNSDFGFSGLLHYVGCRGFDRARLSVLFNVCIAAFSSSQFCGLHADLVRVIVVVGVRFDS